MPSQLADYSEGHQGESRRATERSMTIPPAHESHTPGAPKRSIQWVASLPAST